jgi:hypothetical protein
MAMHIRDMRKKTVIEADARFTVAIGNTQCLLGLQLKAHACMYLHILQLIKALPIL